MIALDLLWLFTIAFQNFRNFFHNFGLGHLQLPAYFARNDPAGSAMMTRAYCFFVIVVFVWSVMGGLEEEDSFVFIVLESFIVSGDTLPTASPNNVHPLFSSPIRSMILYVLYTKVMYTHCLLLLVLLRHYLPLCLPGLFTRSIFLPASLCCCTGTGTDWH